MAITETKKEETKKDDLTGDDLVYSPEKDDYVPAKMSRKLYQQKKQAEARQAVTAGGLALAGEVGQFLVGLSVMDDPTVKSARRDLARLESETKKSGPTMSESEKNRYRESLNVPVQRAQQQLERKAQAIAASTGDQSAQTFLKAAESGLDRIRQQAMQTEAVIAKEQVRRDTERDLKIDKARKEADSIRAMFLDLRNTYQREPIHKFLGDAAKYVGTVAAYQPAPDFSAEIEAAREAGVSEQQLERLIDLSGGPFAKRRVNKYMSEIGVDMPAKKTMETEQEKKLEMERQLEEADEAISMTREKPPTTVTEEPVEGESFDFEGATEEDARKAAGLEDPAVVEANRKRNAAIAALYTKSAELPEKGPLYQKGKYFYGYKDGVWTVYPSRAAWAFDRPFQQAGKPVQFSIEDAQKHPKKGVRELFILATEEGLIK
tara:strand:- start:12248 stop:13549 length:1302 start_codon:yes stop_codon:yes gene_type:complete